MVIQNCVANKFSWNLTAFYLCIQYSSINNNIFSPSDCQATGYCPVLLTHISAGLECHWKWTQRQQIKWIISPRESGRTWQTFLPEACMAIGYYCCLRLSVRPCVNHLLVCAITQDPFKLGSPNLNHRYKRPWLRSLLFCDWPLPSRSKLSSKSKFTPFWACPPDNSSSVQARTTEFAPDVQNTLVKIPVVLGVDWAWHVKYN